MSQDSVPKPQLLKGERSAEAESNRGPSEPTPYRWAKPVHKWQTRAGFYFNTFTDTAGVKCNVEILLVSCC